MRTFPILLLPLLYLTPWSSAQAAGSTAGHARTRELAELGRLPTPLEVVVADIVNYHRHRLPLPRAGQVVAMDVRFGGDAVRPGGEAILQVGFTTMPAGDRDHLPPLNLALVIDCSGSMADAGKMEAVQRGLQAFADRLRPGDEVAVVTYNDEAQVRCRRRPFGDGRWFRRAVGELRPGGATNLHGGLMLGLQEVAGGARARGSNRVILLTDGIANRGVVEPDAILRDARRFTAEDVDLTTVGVGMDLNTELLDRLARGGRGLFHFVADGKDVAKVFVDEVEALVAPAARQAELRLELPEDLDVLQVWGHEYRRERGGLVVALPDMNRGMTAVVLLRCRCDRRAGGGRLAVHAELRAVAAQDHAPIELRESARLRVDEAAGDGLDDPEVRKNHTIAVLAQGLHEMAACAQDGRWADADRALRRALESARRSLPHAEDPDVRAVLQMAEDHGRTLARHVDRFRDQE
jgi:uncharacterized protein YegL